MNGIKKAYSRSYQFALMNGQKLMNYGVPDVIEGPGCIKQLPSIIKRDGVNRVLIVAGKTVSRNGLMDGLIEAAEDKGLDYVIFDGADPNPSIENVEEAYKMYLNEQCNGFVAIGGGSSMDCAKIAAARVANPRKSVEKLGGLMHVTHKIAPFYAVPTTAGTGSETTIAAVVTNRQTQHKYSVNDPKLLPKVAVLDPELTVSLPESVTAATGMDALTHAVEAYTNSFGSKYAYDNAKKAVKLIFENLPFAYTDGTNLNARANMLKASYYAGVAFTRNCVGYVHALGHPLGGLYNVPHGKAMAAILPVVMRAYGDAATERLAQLGTLVGIKGNSKKSVAQKFVKRIENMNKCFDIPTHFSCIRDDDIDKMASFAVAEANPLYPVPAMWDKDKFAEIYRELQKAR